MNSKQKPQVSIESIKQIVKRYKSQGFEALTHHDLATALSTIGFAQVCKEFGAVWNLKHQQEAQKILKNSDYDLRWYGKTNNIRFTNLLTLCQRGDIEKVKDFIRCQNEESKLQMVATTDNFKRNCLHIAVKEGYDVLASYLINQGFSINARDRQLKTPLHYCRNQLICKVLLQSKAKVIVRDNKYCTPVHYAASGSQYQCLQMMLKHSNVVNEVDATKKSPLFYAIYNSGQEQINIIRILLQNGAKPNEKDLYGKTVLHYAAEMGKSRCIPILLQKGASLDIRDKHNKTALDLAANQKVKKIMTAYCNSKGMMFENEENAKRQEFKQINESKLYNNEQKMKDSSTSKMKSGKANSQIYTPDINQVSTWVRQKFFVLMKKLQQSGVKAMWHLKRPYVYTGSWAEDIQSLEDLYDVFLNVNGPEAAMRAFNILCPYQKPLPSVVGKTQEAFQSFFGENWFSTDPVQKIRNMHSTSKIKTQLEAKMRENENLQTELLGYKSQIENLESKIMGHLDQINHYKKIQDQLRRERSKNTQQYTEILRLMNQNEQLKSQVSDLVGGQEKTKILSQNLEDLRSKNQDLIRQMEHIKQVEAAARRKCGKIFLKSLAMAQNNQFTAPSEDNLYDDDSIISLYNLLQNNPPNLERRFLNADRRGSGKLNIDEFTKMLEDLSMLPQDVMSMHRITGFAHGRKTLSLQEFKTILQNRHKNRPMWEKKLLRKIKKIILQNGFTIDKFFTVMDKDGNGTIEATQLRKGLQSHNIFMNQADWSNLFNLMDSDKSGQIDLNQLKTLLDQERTGKLDISQGLTIEIKRNETEKEEENDQKQGPELQKSQQEERQIEKQEQKNEQQKQQEQQQFSQPYSEKDSDEEQGITKLNGTIKIQLPLIKLKGYDQLEKTYVKFFIFDDIDSDDAIKMADMSLKKLLIGAQFKFMEYKILNMEEINLNVSLWSSRQMNEETYIGETNIKLKQAFEKCNQWAINSKYKLSAEEYNKNVKGLVYLQVKWTPQEE